MLLPRYFRFKARRQLLKLCLKLARTSMPEPKHDDSHPFGYFKNPNTQLAIPGEEAAAQVTPEGSIWTGRAEFFTITGDSNRPAEWRRRTFHRGWIPIIEADKTLGDINYFVEFFTEPAGDGTESFPSYYVVLSACNISDKPATARLGMGLLYPEPDHRCRRKPFATERFSPKWKFEMDETGAWRNGKLMYAVIGREGFTSKLEREGKPYESCFEKVAHGEGCCLGILEWHLGPQEERTAHFAIPHTPLPREKALRFLDGLNVKTQRKKAMERWTKLLEPGAELLMPEQKVRHTSLASRVYNFQSQVKRDGEWIQLVNRLHYSHFWLRDCAFISRMWDVWGHHDVAERILLNFLNYARPDGLFCSQKGQLDGVGQALWAFGKHVSITGDNEFAVRVYQHVRRAVEWLARAIRKDRMGLLPPSDAMDNELIAGRYTGHNIWALAGIREAAELARMLDEDTDAESFEEFFNEYRDKFMRHLRAAAARNGGAAPPGLNVKGGEDWGNLLLLYVGELAEPFDELVTTTFDHYRREKYAEGLATWGGFLHHYLTERVAQTALIRGESESAATDFYSMLVHTGPTHEGFEWTIVPWDGRDYVIRLGPFEFANFPPHGWFAAAYNLLLRNMIIREGGGDDAGRLYLFSGLCPAWIRPGLETGMRGAPTDFGRVDAVIKAGENGAVLKIEPLWRKRPELMVFPKPFFIKSWRVKGNTGEAPDEIHLAPQATELELEWEFDRISSLLDYRSHLEKWKSKYRGHYNKKKKEQSKR